MEAFIWLQKKIGNGKVKEIAERFKERNGITVDMRLTDEMKRELVKELTSGILGK